MFLVTGSLDIWIQPIVDKCGCDVYSSIASDHENELKLTSIMNKSNAISDLRAKGYDRIVTVGDGANDVPMFQNADVGISYGGVHSPAPL